MLAAIFRSGNLLYDTPGALVNFAFTLSCAVVAVAIAADIVAEHSEGRVPSDLRIIPDTAAVATMPQGPTTDWLANAERDLAIRPDQAAAWQAYSNAMFDLEASRIEWEHQFAAGLGQSVEAERGRHAMALANAMAELERHLSPEQQTKSRLFTRILAATVICRELAVR